MKSCPTKSSVISEFCDVYGLHNLIDKILRRAHNDLTPPLTSLINNCMGRGIFLENMKFAEVSPSYKKSDNLMKGNYRPVNVLTTWLKLYESTMSEQLFGHFASFFNNILNAFRKAIAAKLFLLNVKKIGNQRLTTISMLLYYLLICQRRLTVCHIIFYWLNLRHMALIYLLAIW